MTTSDPHSPGETPQPPPAAPQGRPGRGPVLTVVALGAAALALLLGMFAAVQSWRAAGRVDQVLDRLDEWTPPPVPTPTTPTEEPTSAPPTGAPGPTGTGAPPVLNAQTEYGERYAAENLRLPAECNNEIYIDLDEPRVKVRSTVAEFYYEDPCGTDAPYINLRGGVEGSLVPSSDVTPFECAENIRTSPMSSDNQPVRRGQVYCIKTSLDEARAAATTWKMVLIEVTATGEDGTVTFRASAWNIPD